MTNTKEVLLNDVIRSLAAARKAADFHTGHPRPDRLLAAVDYYLELAEECARDAKKAYLEHWDER